MKTTNAHNAVKTHRLQHTKSTTPSNTPYCTCHRTNNTSSPPSSSDYSPATPAPKLPSAPGSPTPPASLPTPDANGSNASANTRGTLPPASKPSCKPSCDGANPTASGLRWTPPPCANSIPYLWSAWSSTRPRSPSRGVSSPPPSPTRGVPNGKPCSEACGVKCPPLCRCMSSPTEACGRRGCFGRLCATGGIP